MNNKYFSFVLSSVFLHDRWKSPTSLAIHFRMNLGSKQLNNQPRRWMECSWGRLAGIHIPMGTLQHWELWDTERQVCGSCGANCKWSKVSEKCMEHCWPKKALQRTRKVSALAQRDWNQHCLILSYSCPGLELDGPLIAVLRMWVHYKNLIKESYFFSWSLYLFHLLSCSRKWLQRDLPNLLFSHLSYHCSFLCPSAWKRTQT